MILKNDLAMLYFPNLAPRGARLQLIRYIKENHTLSRELCQAGYDSHRKCCYFTPLQVEIIKRHLGEP